jgi:hypothetical protein
LAFKDWPPASKTLATLGAILTAVVTAAAVDTFAKSDGWIPASRGWVREWAKEPIAERNVLIAQLQRETNEQLEAITEAIDNLSVGQLEGRRDSLDLRLLVLQNELSMLNLRARANPDDQLIDQRRTVVLSLIERAERERGQLNCEIAKRRDNGGYC